MDFVIRISMQPVARRLSIDREHPGGSDAQSVAPERPALVMDRSAPVLRWTIVEDNETHAVDYVEVEDVMRCIEKSGDFGWVAPMTGGGRWIADFEQLFESRDDARKAWIAELNRRIALHQSQLALA